MYYANKGPFTLTTFKKNISLHSITDLINHISQVAGDEVSNNEGLLLIRSRCIHRSTSTGRDNLTYETIRGNAKWWRRVNGFSGGLYGIGPYIL